MINGNLTDLFHQVINELFNRSHRFRELLVADMQEYLELTVETNVDLPLPPPKPAAKLLKEQALRAMQEWYNKFGKAYKKLGLGYTYLKNCKMVAFVHIHMSNNNNDNIGQLHCSGPIIIHSTTHFITGWPRKNAAPTITNFKEIRH